MGFPLKWVYFWGCLLSAWVPTSFNFQQCFEMTSQGCIRTFYKVIWRPEDTLGWYFTYTGYSVWHINIADTSAIPKGLGELQSQADSICGVDRADKESLHVTGERWMQGNWAGLSKVLLAVQSNIKHVAVFYDLEIGHRFTKYIFWI